MKIWSRLCCPRLACLREGHAAGRARSAAGGGAGDCACDRARRSESSSAGSTRSRWQSWRDFRANESHYI